MILYSDHDTSIRIPAQQRVLAIARSRVLYICPSPKVFLVRHCARQFARHGSVHVLHGLKVCREEDVKIALMDLCMSEMSLE